MYNLLYHQYIYIFYVHTVAKCKNTSPVLMLPNRVGTIIKKTPCLQILNRVQKFNPKSNAYKCLYLHISHHPTYKMLLFDLLLLQLKLRTNRK